MNDQSSPRAARPPRPASASSAGVAWAGLFGMTIWLVIALYYRMDGPYSSVVNVLCCGIPMVLWSVLVDKVHRNPTTGMDWDKPARPLKDCVETSTTKLAGLWATWAIIAALYCIFRFYWRGNFAVAMQFFIFTAPILFVLSVPYVFWLDTRLKDQRDGSWHMGALLMGEKGWGREEIYAHLRAWAVKGFFMAFMVSIVPINFREFIATDLSQVLVNPAAMGAWLIALMFVFDVGFAMVGYTLTMKPLDAHIRSATPYAAGWAAALICYPPFLLFGTDGPFNYHYNTADWTVWMAGHEVILAIYGAILVFLTGIYAWATIIFGLRFSNLTDRGIITNGPYAFTKHPAYLSKNIFWWMSALPFLVTSGSVVDSIRNTAIIAMVSGIYYWRAKTEEMHLSANPDYAPYAQWMAKYGLVTRYLNAENWKSRQAKAGAAVATPAE